ncbi:MAG: 1-deoxy-D-xylulose-5-phosphate reductoisomerase, partial [Deferribacterales bacterium]|nr:1-deoxy-D-xylulose-5-phosphate reductoisomerase [Deferribacterales bacterium]
VELFLKKQIKFTDIPLLVEKTVSRFSDKNIFDIEEIFETDILAREMAKKIYNTELKD